VAGNAARHLGRPAALLPTRTGAVTKVGTSPATAAKLDDDGYLWLLGRVDDVMNVSGTASRPPRSNRRWSPPGGGRGRRRRRHDDTTGQAIIAYVTCAAARRRHRRPAQPRGHEIGAIAKPKTIYFTTTCRRRAAARSCASAARCRRRTQPGDTTTLADASIVGETATPRRRAATGED
jgi:acetyl-CoA synthetase